MNNYTTLIYSLKRKIVNFSKKICKGTSKPVMKFITDMFVGISECQKVHLSDIARALKENISLKKTIERLSRNLSNIPEMHKIFENYLKEINEDINDRSIVIIDGSEVVKPASKALEKMCQVRDGSTGEIKEGYWMLEMMILSNKHKMPLPIYSKIYSTKEKDYVSEDDEVLKGLKQIEKKVSKKSIRTMDRGYDANIYYEYYLKNNIPFVIRAKKNRNVVYKNKTRNILEVAKEHKGKYKIEFKSKNRKNIELKISMIPVSLCEFKNKEINLIVVYGFGKEPMILLSNLKSNDKRIAEVITKVYLMRWRIEEYFKFKKQQFDFEDFRVRKITAIKNLNMIVTMLIGLIGLMSEKQKNNKLVIEIISKSKRIYDKKKFVYYAIADGIYEILKKSTKGIKELLCPKPPDITGQIDLLFNLVY